MYTYYKMETLNPKNQNQNFQFCPNNIDLYLYILFLIF